MFRIDKNPLFWWPVTVRWPDPDKPGEFRELAFEAQYRWLNDRDFDALLLECLDKQLLLVDAVPRVCVGVRQVEREDGSPLPHGPDGVGQLCEMQGVPRALWDTYRACRDKAAEKNS